MLKTLLLTVLCLFSCFSLSAQLASQYSCLCSNEVEKKLLVATQDYLEFIHRISQGEEFAQYEAANRLLSPNCQKVFNGSLYTQTRDEFVSDLLHVNATQGCWSVLPVDVILSAPSRTVVLRLMIEMEQFGAFTAMVILRYDEQYQITEINEVLNRVENAYNFEG